MDTVYATRRVGIWVVLPVLLVLILSIDVPPYVPLQDYNEWVYQGYVAAQLIQGHLTDAFRFVTFPVPNSAVQVLLCLLNFVVPAELAGRIVANLYVVVALALGWALARKMSPTQHVSCFFVLLVCVYFNTAFWNGYINYQVGILLFSVWLLLRQDMRDRPLWVFVFSLAAFFTHAVIWASILMLMVIDGLRRRRIAPYLPALVSVGLFAWYAACRPAPTVLDRVGRPGLLNALAYKFYTLAKLGPYHHFIYPGTDGLLVPAAYYTGVAANLAAGLVVVYMLYDALLQAFLSRRGASPPRTETLGAFALLVMFAAMPTVMSDVVNPGERMLYPALMLALLGVGESRGVRWLAPGIAVLALCALSLAVNGARLDDEDGPAVPGSSGQKYALFASRPAEFADVRRMLENGTPMRPLGFETSFLVNRHETPHRPEPDLP